MNKIIVVLISTLLSLIVGCSSTDPAPPTETIEVATSPVSVVATPVTSVSPLPTPVKANVPQPQAGFGTVGGILLEKNPRAEGTFTSVPITPVFLAPVILTDDGLFAFAGLDYNTDPTGTTGETGIFVIRNVPPGQYGIVVLRGSIPYLIKNEKGEDYVISVEAGKALDLGEIHADLPPL